MASVAFSLALLAGLIHTPVDLVVLLLGLVAARPLGAAIASFTGLSRLLARVPVPVRLVLGIAAAVLLDKAYFSLFLQAQQVLELAAGERRQPLPPDGAREEQESSGAGSASRANIITVIAGFTYELESDHRLLFNRRGSSRANAEDL